MMNKFRIATLKALTCFVFLIIFLTDVKAQTTFEPKYLKVTEEQLRAAVSDGSYAVIEDGIAYTFTYSEYTIDTSEVTDMSYMFYNEDEDEDEEVSCKFDMDINHWDVSKVTDMSYMFIGNECFNSNLNDWDVSKVKNMEGMFLIAESFNKPLDKWDVSKVTNMSRMFDVAKSFNQPLDKWDVAQVTSMENMFKHAVSFNQPLASWNVSQVTNMQNMFYSAELFNQPLNKWNVSQVTNMERMFYNAKSFNQPLANWDVSKVNDMKGMFYNAESFNQPLASWHVSNVAYMDYMFYKAKSFKQDLSSWRVLVNNPQPTNFIYDSYPTNFLPKWNTLDTNKNFQPKYLTVTEEQLRTAATDRIYAIIEDGIKYTFEYSEYTVDTSKVTDMSYLFSYEPAPSSSYQSPYSFNIDINHWDVSSVTNMSNMFYGALLFNQPLNNWDVSNVTNMSGMFDSAESFNQPLNNWDVSKVSDMSYMFYYAEAFKQDLSAWRVPLITAPPEKFIRDYYPVKLLPKWGIENTLIDWGALDTKRDFEPKYLTVTEEQLRAAVSDGSYAVIADGITYTFAYSEYTIDTSEITNMSSLFYESSNLPRCKFNKNISHWDVSKVTDMSWMFSGEQCFNKPLNNWDVSKVKNMEGMFLGTLSFNQPLDKWDVSQVTNMSRMFENAESFDQPLATWDISRVRNMNEMFKEVNSFKQDLSTWPVPLNTPQPIDFIHDYYPTNFLPKWGILESKKDFQPKYLTVTKEQLRTAVIDGTYSILSDGINYMFEYSEYTVDTSKITDMSYLFDYESADGFCCKFNGDISHWDVSKVTDMRNMFSGSFTFNQPLNNWDVSNVVNMQGMFSYTESFNQPLDKWDVSKVSDMSDMFNYAKAFKQDLSSWRVPLIIAPPEKFIRDDYSVELLPKWGK